MVDYLKIWTSNPLWVLTIGFFNLFRTTFIFINTFQFEFSIKRGLDQLKKKFF